MKNMKANKVMDTDLRERATADLSRALDIPFADAEEILDRMDQEVIKEKEAIINGNADF